MEINWEKSATAILRAELMRRNLTYEMLHLKLKSTGVNVSVGGIKTRLMRGSFSFSFFLQCAVAIGIKTIHLDNLFESEK